MATEWSLGHRPLEVAQAESAVAEARLTLSDTQEALSALLFGGSVGGAFFGGLAMGKSGDAGGTETVATTAPQSQAADQRSFPQLQEQLRSGELTQEDPARLREQFGGGGTTGGFAGAGLSGAIESVQDGTLTVNTAQGSLQASIGPDTAIHTLAEITPEDLSEGMQVTVTGERGGDSYEIHYDRDFANHRGLREIIVHGALKAAFLGQLVTNWVGGSGTLTKLSAPYRKMDARDDKSICTGIVNAKRKSDIKDVVDCTLGVENAWGEKTTYGTATITIS